MSTASLEEETYDEDPETQDFDTETPEKRKRGRPARKLYWRKIEDYWENRRLQDELEDIFFQSTDSETLI